MAEREADRRSAHNSPNYEPHAYQRRGPSILSRASRLIDAAGADTISLMLAAMRMRLKGKR